MSETIKSFTGLIAWKNSHQLVIAVFQFCESLPKNDALKNQIERSVLSITSNIAEGFGRQSVKDKQHFYVMARGSAYEVQNQLLVARDTGKISDKDFEKLVELSLNSIKPLHGLIRSLNVKKANS
jgi:four helix bundle protein